MNTQKINRFMIGLSALVILTAPVAAEDYVIGPIKNAPGDIGCTLELKNPKGKEPLIFRSNPDGIWMNFNNVDEKLESIDSNDQDRISKYKFKDIDITIIWGKGKGTEGGTIYNNSLIKIQNGKQLKVIPAKGGCGC